MKKQRIPRPARLPTDKADPTGVDALERQAMRRFRVKMRDLGKRYAALIDRIPSAPAVNLRYTFQLDQNLLSSLLQNAASLADEILLEGGRYDMWLYEDYIKQAYRRGTAQEFYNMGQQSPGYKAYRQSLQDLYATDAYQNRLVLIRARAFEEMQGLSNTVKADLARTLTDGLGRGLNPAEIARNIQTQTGIETKRANRIARTEITTALRRARWDEADAAEDDLGLDNRLLHLSALSPTTRQTHANRHGHVYTRDEVREWYTLDANAINCKCSQTAILVDKDGNPLNPSVIQTAREQAKRYWGKQHPKTNALSVCGCGSRH